MATTFLTLELAATRLGLSRTETRELRSLTFINDTRGVRVLNADVVRLERQREHEGRQAEIRAARRSMNMAAKIADDERWLRSIEARGGSSLALEDLRAKLASDKIEFEAIRAEQEARTAKPLPHGRLHQAQLQVAEELRRDAIRRAEIERGFEATR
jgi:hypothetical protein